MNRPPLFKLFYGRVTYINSFCFGFWTGSTLSFTFISNAREFEYVMCSHPFKSYYECSAFKLKWSATGNHFNNKETSVIKMFNKS